MDYNKKFVIACQHGDLKTCQYLSSVYNISVKFNEIFREACRDGYLDLAKYLIEKYPQIDVTSAWQAAIGWSCSNGHLETAKWLVELPEVDIRADDDYAFIHSCEHNHRSVIEWILQYYPQANNTHNITRLILGNQINDDLLYLLVKSCHNINLVDIINVCYRKNLTEIIGEIIIEFDIIELDLRSAYQREFNNLLRQVHNNSMKSARKN